MPFQTFAGRVVTVVARAREPPAQTVRKVLYSDFLEDFVAALGGDDA
jgi:hypothetical protein